jgi:hypothetical protein
MPEDLSFPSAVEGADVNLVGPLPPCGEKLAKTA